MNKTYCITLHEVLKIHSRMIELTGGSSGIRDLNRLESALMSPQQTFDQLELYPTIIEKAAILGFSIISNHPKVFLNLNGYSLISTIDEDEAAILAVASSQWRKEHLIQWLEAHVVPLAPEDWV